MSLLLAVVSSVLGWLTLAALSVWYWRVIVPDLYVDDSVWPFVLVTSLSALAFLAILVGGWRRANGARDGMPAMIMGLVVVVAVMFSTLSTTGILFAPSFLIGSLAVALPAKRPATVANQTG